MFVPLILILLSLGLMIYVFVRLTKHSVIAVHKYIRINCYFALSGSILHLLGLLFRVNNGVLFEVLRFINSLAYLNMFVALFTMSFMICAGIVRSFIQPIKVGPSRSEMVEKRFSEWYGLHVLQGNRISFMQFVFLGLTDNISRIGGNMPSEKKVQGYYIGVFITTFFFAINSFYFLANVLREMSIIDRLAPSINMLDSIEPILESFQYLVVWSVETLTSLIGIDSVLIALATYELAMLIFFITKRQILQRHQHEYFFIHDDDEIHEILKTENEYLSNSEMFWERTFFGSDNQGVRETFGGLYHLNGNHWIIEYQTKIRNDDPSKLEIHQKVDSALYDGTWDEITDEEYWISEECRSFDYEIFNNEHSITIHGETKDITQKSTNFPAEVLEIIQMRIDEENSSLIES